MVWFPYVMTILSLCVQACHPNLGITVASRSLNEMMPNYKTIFLSEMAKHTHPQMIVPIHVSAIYTICNYRLNFQRASAISLTMRQHDLPDAFVSIFLWRSSYTNSRGHLALFSGSCRKDLCCFRVMQSSYFANICLHLVQY